jgi:glycosyltransferase involved in cell wall biosynthesis
MPFDITIYCPDTHILYDASLPDRKGVGGGVLARIRFAYSLAHLGHRVTIIANVTHPHRKNNVDFLPLSHTEKKRATDVLILVSSGGELSLLPALNLKIEAKWRNVWSLGTVFIKGIDSLEWDQIISCSNFVHQVIKNEWPLSDPKCFTIYPGASQLNLSPVKFPLRRNPYRLVYISHPSKGLDAAIAVLEKLRRFDQRYHLFIFGGDSMYGGKDTKHYSGPGITYFGTRRHSEALSALRTSLVSFVLQARQEPFGMVLTESMLQGAIPLASPVGAYVEVVSHGENGILIPGNHQSDEAHTIATDWILRFNQNPDLAAYIRRNAMHIPWDWDTIAKVWTGYWEWVLHRKGTILPNQQRCVRCQGNLIALADGYHCIECGWYHRTLASLL